VATPEGQVLKAVCAYLDLQERLGRCWYRRQNNGGVWHPHKTVFLKPNGSGHKDGVPDIGLVIQGRFYAVECKSATGRHSDGQKRFEAGLVKCQGQYLVVRSVRDLESLF
jgi:hypothetical protein